MRVLIVFNHPYDGSYCAAILHSVIAGLQKANHEVDLIHLDKDGFNPVMTAEDLAGYTRRAAVDPKALEYQQRLKQANHLVFIFPIWWELMPAMTKGFIDKVIFPGVAFDHDKRGRFRKKLQNLNGITLITTMNTPSIVYRVLFGNAVKKAMFTGTFWKLGYKNRKWISLNLVKSVSSEKRKAWLHEIERRFERLK